MDWELLAVGLFAAGAIYALRDAIRQPGRWRLTNTRRWRHVSGWMLILTAAALAGAAAAGASATTLGVIAVFGIVMLSFATDLWSIAWMNRILDRLRR